MNWAWAIVLVICATAPPVLVGIEAFGSEGTTNEVTAFTLLAVGAVLSVVYTIWWQKEAALLVLAIASVTVGIAGATYAVADRMAVGIKAELTATAVLVTSIVIAVGHTFDRETPEDKPKQHHLIFGTVMGILSLTPAILVSIISQSDLLVSGDWSGSLLDATLTTAIVLSWVSYAFWMLYFTRLRRTVLKDGMLLLATLVDVASFVSMAFLWERSSGNSETFLIVSLVLKILAYSGSHAAVKPN